MELEANSFMDSRQPMLFSSYRLLLVVQIGERMKRANPARIFWSHIYNIQELSRLIKQMSNRQLDEKSLTNAAKRFDNVTKRLEKQLDRLEKIGEVKD